MQMSDRPAGVAGVKQTETLPSVLVRVSYVSPCGVAGHSRHWFSPNLMPDSRDCRVSTGETEPIAVQWCRCWTLCMKEYASVHVELAQPETSILCGVNSAVYMYQI